MDMDQGAIWLAGSILVMLGVIVIVMGVLVINNLLANYWKPVKWAKYNYHSVYYDPVSGEQLISKSTTQKEANE